jgi:hypothetical protein
VTDAAGGQDEVGTDLGPYLILSLVRLELAAHRISSAFIADWFDRANGNANEK